MEFRLATQADLDYVAENSVSRGMLKQIPEQTDYVYTFEHEGLPLGVGGLRLINLTTAWCWMDMTPISHKYIKTFYRTVSEWRDSFAKEHGLRRLQAYIECDFPEAVRMIEHLGFEKESIMENFIGDKDAFMYKRIL